ncbi:phosphoenolpyruvate--protein phosphotransferase [Janibacter corallicola]|uniref:phosphoenolpyruvate--protein phosphotransferase n=1 Tax=Janibacter corallicola TaxID=415212 RepID=UPI000829C831|nr:phosphoenolpyruvate--protein phosphotransferase [Janibacter corallicola]
MADEQVRTGLGVSGGFAHGPVVVVAPTVRAPRDEPPPDDVGAAAASVTTALADVATELERRAASTRGEAAEILTATALIARDRSLVTAARAHLDAGEGPATATESAVEDFAAQLEAVGGYVAERVADLRDVGARAVAHLLGVPAPGVPRLTERSVVVADDLAPAETAALDRDLVAAIVTSAGGRTGHTAIIAAQREIPAVVQCRGATDIAPGTIVAVDGDEGSVTLAPHEETLAALARRTELRAAALAAGRGPGRTSDGHPVALLANVGDVADVEEATAQDVEGVGLLRTEFLFLSAKAAPTLHEQAEAYRRVLAPFAGRRVVVRTLDAGADKPLAFADLGPEDNPALGRRGMRLSRARPDLLDTQLAALADAARDTDTDLRVMAPMIATVEEAAWFVERVRAHGLPSAGVMVEVPAAALRSRQVLAEVDFASIGTNDLAQYTLAADRTQGELADLLDPWQPAVLDLVAATGEGAAATGTPLGVCGEAGGDPLLALVLVGLGATSLSMAPSRAPMVRYALARHTLAACRDIAHAARGAADASRARRAALDLADPGLRELL